MKESSGNHFLLPSKMETTNYDIDLSPRRQTATHQSDREEETVAIRSRKRGRPRKHVIHETLFEPDVAIALGKPTEKRGRGRPRGSRSHQRMSELGGYNLCAFPGDGNFIPVAMTIRRGQDILEKVKSFIQKGNQAICVLVASGSVAVADVRPNHNSSRVVHYEGNFEILTLAGSYICVDAAGLRNIKPFILSATLAYPDGRVFGGAIGGSLIAATPVRLVMGIVKEAKKKQNIKKLTRQPQSSMKPRGNEAAGKSEDCYASPERSVYQNALQPFTYSSDDNGDLHNETLDQVCDDALSNNNNSDKDDGSQPLDQASSKTPADDDDGDE